MLTGLLVIGVTYYSASIPTPTAVPPPQSTTIYYSNGHVDGADRQGDPDDRAAQHQMPVDVQHAVIATEDSTFYSNIGVDVKGIARAFVNNVTGGETQGASTITQQYARAIANADLLAVVHPKAPRDRHRDQAAQHHDARTRSSSGYLNPVPFGRGAYGIQAAAQGVLQQGRARADAWPRAWCWPT